MNERIFKFRAWDTIENKMVDVGSQEGLMGEEDYPTLSLFFINCDWDTPVRRSRYILMQYTGLRDTNVKEIYEGDIVEYFDWCYCSKRVSNNGIAKIEYPFTNAHGDSWINRWNPLRGIVKWNEKALTYDPLVNATDDYNSNSFGYVCGHKEDENYPDSYIEVIGNIYESKYLLDNIDTKE